ncbi:hypothetical protein [Tardiphaga robiniae]|uniref:Uncharacterized protein n=1 Tax=Tardiphaga robiniae TaxID=943830 RepID=A0A7G6U4R5_9BRAD|nr:hypothetical protein [Tardiphaga robiniae]QND73997.1 hypothetical protein HB776_24480 [Tardiphaga robiniae]
MLHSPDIQIILRKENAGIKSAGMDTQPHPTQSDPFYRAVAPLIGLPAWFVRRGHGSFLTLEFGAPSLRIREPKVSPDNSGKVAALSRRRKVLPRGEWHLWIYCCHWRVLSRGEEIAWSEASDKKISAATSELDGQILTAAEADPAQGTSVFKFDLGATLQTWPYGSGDTQWMLYMPSGDVFSYREDGSYSSGPGSLPPEQVVWQPLRPDTTD